MNNLGRFLGIALIIGGILVGIIITVLMTTYRAEGRLSAGGMVLGLALGYIVLVLPQLGIGALLIWKGGADAKTAVNAQEQRQLLNIVQTHGQVAISEVVIKMNSNVNHVQSLLYQLVGMGLYTGYINWDEGMLYSEQALNLRELTHCQHCNGQLELAGHGVIRCPFCGTEYFLD